MVSTLGMRSQRLGRGKVVGFAAGVVAGSLTARTLAPNSLTISSTRAAALAVAPSVSVSPTAPAPTFTLPSDYGAQVQGNFGGLPTFSGIWG
ncbi:MAG: hypothetical protein E6Q97_27700 [Desulfurellales bacterium]|nr:MAG: hypothetical protein E6Q97_27700 [Desulfurellales bacterium]